jgi:hypothetical protein
MGPKKLQTTLALGTMGPPKQLSLMECTKIVKLYRRINAEIVAFWGECERVLQHMCAGGSGRFGPDGILEYDATSIWLPNGMGLHYPGLRMLWDSEKQRPAGFKYISNGAQKHIYGGLLTENIVQALAGVVIRQEILEVRALYQKTKCKSNEIVKIVTMTHDEIVSVVPERMAQKLLDANLKIMRTPPAWAPDLPIWAAAVTPRAAAAAATPKRVLISTGVFRVTRQATSADPTYDIVIEELPVTLWTQDYLKILGELIKFQRLESFVDNSTCDQPSFTLRRFSPNPITREDRARAKAGGAGAGAAPAVGVGSKKKRGGAAAAVAPSPAKRKKMAAAAPSAAAAAPAPPPPVTAESLYLVKKFSLNNFILLDNDVPRKFGSIGEIIERHRVKMDEHFVKIKAARLARFGEELRELQSKHSLISAIVDGRLSVFRRPAAEINADIEKLGLSVDLYDALKMKDATADNLIKLEGKISEVRALIDQTQRAHHTVPWLQKLRDFRAALLAVPGGVYRTC